MGENIWGRSEVPGEPPRIRPRPARPAPQGQALRTSACSFRAKQKLKGYYGDISEKQFRATYDEAARRKGDTPENLIGLLESRLDAIVYRAKFVPTVFAARQFVNHGHVKVNGVRVNIGSYPLQGRRRDRGQGQVQAARDRSGIRRLAERDVPDYIEADHNKMKATFNRVPGLADVPYPVVMEPHLVIEFYSR
jgi:small subunit ribosomal protein S4